MFHHSDLFCMEAGTPLTANLNGSGLLFRKASANHLTSHLKHGVGSWKPLPLISDQQCGGEG